jgi:hypothetical protein
VRGRPDEVAVGRAPDEVEAGEGSGAAPRAAQDIDDDRPVPYPRTAHERDDMLIAAREHDAMVRRLAVVNWSIRADRFGWTRGWW